MEGLFDKDALLSVAVRITLHPSDTVTLGPPPPRVDPKLTRAVTPNTFEKLADQSEQMKKQKPKKNSQPKV